VKHASCENESLVLAAARSGTWTPELSSHLLKCSDCSDAVLVDDFLHNDAALTRADASLPDPSLIWWKAQCARRNRAMSLAGRPVRAAQMIAYLAGLVALLWVAVPYSEATPWAGEVSAVLGRAMQGVTLLVILGVAACLVCMSLGSAYLAWSEN
jgi:hypothetical protein